MTSRSGKCKADAAAPFLSHCMRLFLSVICAPLFISFPPCLSLSFFLCFSVPVFPPFDIPACLLCPKKNNRHGILPSNITLVASPLNPNHYTHHSAPKKYKQKGDHGSRCDNTTLFLFGPEGSGWLDISIADRPSDIPFDIVYPSESEDHKDDEEAGAKIGFHTLPNLEVEHPRSVYFGGQIWIFGKVIQKNDIYHWLLCPNAYLSSLTPPELSSRLLERPRSGCLEHQHLARRRICTLRYHCSISRRSHSWRIGLCQLWRRDYCLWQLRQDWGLQHEPTTWRRRRGFWISPRRHLQARLRKRR